MRSHVVTGGARGVGRAVVDRLLAQGDVVVAVDRDAGGLAGHPNGRARVVAGDVDGGPCAVGKLHAVAAQVAGLRLWSGSADVEARAASGHRRATGLHGPRRRASPVTARQRKEPARWRAPAFGGRAG